MAASDSAGNSLAAYRYGPYGEPDSWSAGALASRFRYTGQIMIGELGLYHYKARTYSPWLGRFLSTDPIGYGDGMNLYAYVGNDPVNMSDPSGMCGESFALLEGRCVPVTVINGVRDPPQTLSGTIIIGGPPALSGIRRGNYGVSPPPQPQDEEPCSAALPDGSTINENVRTMRRIAADTAARSRTPQRDRVGYGSGFWLRNVVPGGNWDYKRHGGTAAQGNVNYGATGRELGLSLRFLQWAGGVVQQIVNPSDPGNQGSPADILTSTDSMYGDQPLDQSNVATGYGRCNG